MKSLLYRRIAALIEGVVAGEKKPGPQPRVEKKSIQDLCRVGEIPQLGARLNRLRKTPVGRVFPRTTRLLPSCSCTQHYVRVVPRRTRPANPMRPVPSNVREPGSGTTLDLPWPRIAASEFGVMYLIWPLRAVTRP